MNKGNEVVPQARILMIYIEPTPYILGLISALQFTWDGQIDVLFLTENASQNWEITLDERWMVLPENSREKVYFLSRLFLRNKYCLIHIAGWGHPWLLLFIVTAKLARIPIVAESDTPFFHHKKLSKYIIKRLLYPILFNLINLFLPGGTKQVKYLRHYGVKSARIIPVQMTVDVSGMQRYAETLTDKDRQRVREVYGINKNDVVFLFVGRLIVHKGIIDLILAFSRIKNQNVILLFVGDGELRQKIEKAAKADEKISYAGRLSGKELVETYYAADVLVLPSYFEPWGLVVNEAMAMGRPVIVSDKVGCIDDLVDPHETGIVVKAGRISELQSAIEYLMNAPDKRKAMGRQAAQKIANWTLENEANKITQGWSSLLCL